MSEIDSASDSKPAADTERTSKREGTKAKPAKKSRGKNAGNQPKGDWTKKAIFLRLGRRGGCRGDLRRRCFPFFICPDKTTGWRWVVA
jgi:hypothetical protein